MSIWADLQDRCSGEVVRKEDDVNFLTLEGFFDYITSRYCLMSTSNMFEGCIIIPVISDFSDGFSYRIYYYPGEKRICFAREVMEYFPDFRRMLKRKFRCLWEMSRIGSAVSIFPKGGKPVDNQFFLDVLDYIIENGDKDMVMLKKKEE